VREQIEKQGDRRTHLPQELAISTTSLRMGTRNIE